MPGAQSQPSLRYALSRLRIFWIVVALAIVAGIGFRVEHVVRRQMRADESMTALRVSGHTFASVNALFNDREYSARQILRYQRVDPQRSTWATIAGLESEEPQTTPLFFVLDRLWAGIAGSSIASLRVPSLLASLASIAAFLWLCFELTRSRVGAGAGAAFIAVSPFFIDYGTQARQYALWTLLVIAGCVLLLRALRLNRAVPWAWYAATMALALYTDPLTLLVLAAHAIYLLFRHAENRRNVAAFGAASGCALLLFLPWALLIIRERTTSAKLLAWTNVPLPPREFVQTWAMNVVDVLFDAEWAHRWLDPVAIGIFALIGYSVYRAGRDQRREAMWFLAVLALSSALPFLLYDGVTKSHGSIVSRFLTPLWIALLVWTAALFASRLAAHSGRVAAWWLGAFCAVIALGTASSAVNSASAVWWDNHDFPSSFVGRMVDRGEHPLVLLNRNPNPIVLVLSHYVTPNTRFLLYARKPRFPADLAASTFLVMPDPSTLSAFRNHTRYGLQQLPLPSGWPNYGFYRIVTRSPQRKSAKAG
jgi:uncharacterized membrane protein